MKYIEKPFNSKRSAVCCALVTAITLVLGIILFLLKLKIGILVVVVGVIIPVLFCLLRKYPKEGVPEFVGRMGLIRYNNTFEPFYIDFENRLWCFGYPDEVGVCGLVRNDQITEDDLREPVLSRFSMYTDNIFYTTVEFGVRVVLKGQINQSRIKTELSSVRSDLEHIVDRRINISCIDNSTK